MMIKVLLVEDQAMVRGALRALLDLEKDIRVVATASNGREALEIFDNCSPDLVVSDIEMPGMTGLELAEQLQRLINPPKVVMLTTFSRSGYIRRALNAGVNGYLLKDAPPSQLASCIRQVSAGKTVVAPELVQQALKCGDNPLSTKEQKILQLAYTGKTTEEIAREISLSAGTIRNYIHSSCQKLNVSNRVEAARLAQNYGWIGPTE
ncbi:response regulator [Microbulbifer sp. EKSA008]|uniref:response regulator n=1 Tax=Microbulbifer sp. EKSA008 TaxID=3243367 RepID=UPI004040EC91